MLPEMSKVTVTSIDKQGQNGSAYNPATKLTAYIWYGQIYTLKYTEKLRNMFLFYF